MGGDLKTSLRHLAFVQPRFESFVSPRRRYACLLRAIAQVLVTKAGDPRLSSEVRKRADAALNAMSGRDCFAAGLAGDYGEVCLEFLRYFDVSDHDPARTATEVEGFVKALRCLFVEGYVLCSSGETEIPGLGARKTLAQIALENIEEPLKMEALADRSRLNLRRMERLFNAHLDAAPAQFYRRLRLEKARDLLLHTSLPTLEVACLSGFSSSSHFAMAYQRQFGVRPSEARRDRYMSTDRRP